jgi:hypothetical protein
VSRLSRLSRPLLPLVAMAGGLLAAAGCAPAGPDGSAYRLNLAGVPEGQLPPGWKAAATNSTGAPAEWKVVAEPKSPDRSRVLALAKIGDASKGHFNLCWTDAVRMKDGTLVVDVRADSGTVDQGGGLIWRARDANNYYVARYNPLETNFRLYYVKDGKRIQLASAEGLKIKAGEWFTLKVVASGDRFEGWLGDRKLLEATDGTFPEAGGVGFWTKADAATSFFDLTVEPAAAGPAPQGGRHIQTYSR